MATTFADIDGNTLIFPIAPVPDLGLTENRDFKFRVYVLQCESSSYYVGIVPTQKVRERIEAQFSGVGSDYCKEKKPTRILCIWPAKCEAIKAAVFYGMQQVLNAQDKRTLGG